MDTRNVILQTVNSEIAQSTRVLIMEVCGIKDCPMCKSYFFQEDAIDASDEGKGWTRCPNCGCL